MSFFGKLKDKIFNRQGKIAYGDPLPEGEKPNDAMRNLQGHRDAYAVAYTQVIEKQHPDLSPEDLQKHAMTCAEHHMNTLHPTSQLVSSQRESLAKIDKPIDEMMKQYTDETRALEASIQQSDIEMEGLEVWARHSPEYLSFMMETRQFDKDISQQTGLKIRLRNHHIEKLTNHAVNAHEEIKQGIIEANDPDLLDVVSLREDERSQLMNKARKRNKGFDRHFAEEKGLELDEVAIGSGIQQGFKDRSQRRKAKQRAHDRKMEEAYSLDLI